MIINETDRDGVSTVHRCEGERPFAELYAPRVVGNRKWGIKYRGPGDQPFGDTFNVCPDTREAAVAELDRTMRVCSDHQLCLE